MVHWSLGEALLVRETVLAEANKTKNKTMKRVAIRENIITETEDGALETLRSLWLVSFTVYIVPLYIGKT